MVETESRINAVKHLVGIKPSVSKSAELTSMRMEIRLNPIVRIHIFIGIKEIVPLKRFRFIERIGRSEKTY